MQLQKKNFTTSDRLYADFPIIEVGRTDAVALIRNKAYTLVAIFSVIASYHY